MGANGEYPTPWYTTSNHRPLARPHQAHRRDTKPNLNSKRDGGVGSCPAPSSMTSVSLPDLASTTKKKPSSQLFPIDTSELDTVKHMWTQQGRSKRAMELISGDLVGMRGREERAIGPEPSAFAPTCVASALAAASPSTSTSTSYSSLPSALFSSFRSSSTSSASTITVVCKSSPDPETSRCIEDCCVPLQKRSKVETYSTMQSPSKPTKGRSLSLSLPKTTSVTRTPVSPTDSPLHVLLDQAKREGLCSAELAILENATKAKIRAHARSRSRSLSAVKDLRSQSAPSASRSLIEDFISFASKLPLSYSLSYDIYSSTDDEIFPLHHISQRIPRPKNYALKFPPPLPQPRSPFRSQSPVTQQPTARFRLVENKEYLRLKAVWNRLAEDQIFLNSYELYRSADPSFGIGLDELDCGCDGDGECDCDYEDEQSRNQTNNLSRTSRTSHSRSSQSLPPPPTALVDREGNLHTGCELVVGIAIDGLGESGLGIGRRGDRRKRDGSRRSLTGMGIRGGLSFAANLVSSSKLSSVSYSVRQALDLFRQIGEIQVKHSTQYASVGASTYGHKTTGALDIHSHRTGPEGL